MANPQNLKNFTKGDPRINRKGRPKKLPELDKLLIAELGQEDSHNVSEMQKILRALKTKAKKGNERCAEILMDRAFGKVAQRMVVDGIEIEQTFFILPNGRKIQI